MGKRKLDVGYK